jgi:outer membrane protein TolC
MSKDSRLIYTGVIFFLIGTPNLDGAEGKRWTEEELVRLHRNSSSALKSIEAQRLQRSLENTLDRERFSTRLIASGGRTTSHEQPLTPFQPVLSPMDSLQVGAQRKLNHGIQVSATVFGSQVSTPDGLIDQASQVGAKLEVQIDLLKNRLGALDRAQTSAAEIRAKRADLEAKISNMKQELAVRKLYWSLVANEQSLNLTKQLHTSAQRQLKEAQSRKQAGIADDGEVARYLSQVQSRNATTLTFEYERELLWQSLSSQLDGLEEGPKSIDIASAASKESEVTQCLHAIQIQKQYSEEFTLHDDVVRLLGDEYSFERQTFDQHDAASLALVGSLQTSGVGDSYAKAQSEVTKEFRSGSYVGLQLNMPLGDTVSRSKQALLQAKEVGLAAESESIQKQVRSTFVTMQQSVALLAKGLANQRDNTGSLRTSYRDTFKKFEQGRIPVNTLIIEQDALFQSELQEINVRKQIAHALLDYFAIFQAFPCSWSTTK